MYLKRHSPFNWMNAKMGDEKVKILSFLSHPTSSPIT